MLTMSVVREPSGCSTITCASVATAIQRVQNDAAFAPALLDEAATLFLNGEPETARLIRRDLVNATIGFERLAAPTAKPSKSLHWMKSPTGKPSMDKLAAIYNLVSTAASDRFPGGVKSFV